MSGAFSPKIQIANPKASAALGENSLAAAGATTAISDLLIEFLNGIVCRSGIVIATFFGAQDEKKIKDAIGNSVLLSIGRKRN